MSQPTPAAATRGALRDTGYRSRTVKAEIRDNLLARLRAGETAFPGIVGFDDTVLPELERALLAGHDLVLLGERGQGKTRLIRTLVDAARRVDAGRRRLRDQRPPDAPGLRRAAAGSRPSSATTLPVAWLHRDERYGEKLATPDTSVGDLIGDVDPIKVAEGRTLGDPETVHYGLVPRTNRGIFAVNELPDLAERIQVALLNVLEERDIQVRGYPLRLPLDLLLVASANPEDYTNRGRIITPLKDRFGAEIRTHYPLDLSRRGRADRAGGGARRRRARAPARGGRPVRPAGCASRRRSTTAPACQRPVRDRRRRDGRRLRAAPRRPRRRGRRRWPGSCDVPTRDPDAARQGRVRDRRGGPRGRGPRSTCCGSPIAETFRARLGGLDLSGFTELFAEGAIVETGELVPAAELLARSAPCRAWPRCSTGSATATTRRPGEVAAGVEFVLEGLHLTRRHRQGRRSAGRTVYGALSDDAAFRYGPWQRRARPARAAVRRPRGARRGRPRRARRRLAARGAARPAAPRASTAAAASTTSPTRVRRMRDAARRRGDLGGTLDQVRAALDQALAAGARRPRRRGRRRRPAGRDGAGDAPRRHRRRGAGAGDYDWHSRRGAGDVRADPGDAAARGARRAVRRAEAGAASDPDPAAMQAVKDMLADLNALLAAHARGEDTDGPVPRVHGQARRPLPGEPGERRRADRRARPPAGRGRADDGARCRPSSASSSAS